MFQLDKRSKTTPLLQAIKMESTIDRIKTIKLSFYQRLLENTHTKQIMVAIRNEADKLRPEQREKLKVNLL